MNEAVSHAPQYTTKAMIISCASPCVSGGALGLLTVFGLSRPWFISAFGVEGSIESKELLASYTSFSYLNRKTDCSGSRKLARTLGLVPRSIGSGRWNIVLFDTEILLQDLSRRRKWKERECKESGDHKHHSPNLSGSIHEIILWIIPSVLLITVCFELSHDCIIKY